MFSVLHAETQPNEPMEAWEGQASSTSAHLPEMSGMYHDRVRPAGKPTWPAGRRRTTFFLGCVRVDAFFLRPVMPPSTLCRHTAEE